MELIKALPALAFWGLARWLPADAASRLGAGLGELLGRVHRKRRQVLRNLAHVYPELDDEGLSTANRESWRNAGSVLAELPHLDHIVAERVDVSIAAATEALLDAGQPVVFASAHTANWEVVPKVLAARHGPVLFVFTPFDNRHLTRALQRFRRCDGAVYVAKEGALSHMMRARREGRSIGVMGDIRVDAGEMLDLFGAKAATSIAAFRVAQRLGYPIVPVHARRTSGARFQVTLEAPLEFDDATDQGAAVELAERFNRRLEEWLRVRPNQWWCTKRRWPIREPQPARPVGEARLDGRC